MRQVTNYSFDNFVTSNMYGEKVICYFDLIKVILSAPLDRNSGILPEEMRKSIKIIDKIDGLLETKELDLLLEEADFEFVTKKLNRFPFPFVHKELLKFIDSVNNAQEVDVETKK